MYAWEINSPDCHISIDSIKRYYSSYKYDPELDQMAIAGTTYENISFS
jgi:hypothetical protein